MIQPEPSSGSAPVYPDAVLYEPARVTQLHDTNNASVLNTDDTNLYNTNAAAL